MKTPRKASPARSQEPLRTPIRHRPRRTHSVSSDRSSSSGIISPLCKMNNASFMVSPLGTRKSILSDNTEIEEPRRKSWWTNLGEHSTASRDIVEILEANENVEPNNIIEELDMEILSQENKKNYTLDLPESSDSESINSIVITQRKLFPQKTQKQKHFAQIVGPRESLTKQHDDDKTLVTGTRELFQNKQRSRPIFPAALLNISRNETVADKTKEFATAEPKAQVRNIFGQRNTKRKNIFTNFILTESDDEISDIQPKVFGMQKTIEASRRSSLRGTRAPSPASSITTDMEMDEWKMLPSSTMVENQLEVLMTGQTPKRARLSNLTEMESDAGSNASKQSKKSNSPKEDKSRKSKTFTKEKAHVTDLEEIVECDYETAGNIDKSRKSKTFTKEKACEYEIDNEIINESMTLVDDSENQNCSKAIENIQEGNPDKEEENDEELNFTLHYENDDEEEVIPETQSKSMTSKNMTRKDISADSGKENKSMPNKVEESAKIESSQDKNISKGDNNGRNLQQSLHVSGNDPDGADNIESEQKTMNKSKDISQGIENEDEQINQSEVAPDEVDNASDNEEENAKQNESEAADEIDKESDNEDEQEKKFEHNEADNEEHELSLEQNQSEPDNESQGVEDDKEENQNEMHAVSDTELNESQVQNKRDRERNESQVQNESDTERNESQVQNESYRERNESQVQNESDRETNESQVQNESDKEQNESDTEQNESQAQNESIIQEEDSAVEHDESQEEDEENDEEQEEQESDAEKNESDVQDEERNESEQENEQESEAIIESGNENENNSDNSQDKGVDSEYKEDSAQLDIIETLETVRHDSRNLNYSYFSVKDDKTVRKTVMPNSTTHRGLDPVRESAGFSDGSSSSAQGSGWDSHRTTRKTLRLTYGRDFTPRKSLRALVMEKSAKRQTQHNEMASVTAPMFPQANSTEMPSTRFDNENENRSPNDISLGTRQTKIEQYLMGVAKMNAERRQKMIEKVNNELKEPQKLKIFKIPATPLFARNVAPKPKQSKAALRAAKATRLFGELPPEVLEDLKYKPPKRFQPRDAPWATKHLYKFLEDKLEPKYQYKARVRAERLVEHVYNFTKDLRRRTVAAPDAVEVLKQEMARLHIVKTHHDFYEFFGKFMPRDVRRKVMPDIINNIDLPRQGVFSDIL